MPDSFTICPGCGLKLLNKNANSSNRYYASGECIKLFDELTAINLSGNYMNFIHQLAVDAYAAQHAGYETKSISTAFALIGLCLAVEHSFTGRQVQLIHMKIPKQQWQKFSPPTQKASMTVKDVLQFNSHLQREEYIKKWAASVWNIWKEQHEWVRNKIKELIDN